MTNEQKKIFVVIHGHFYQPPRENPWMQAIPRQESAAPYHDWNERITSECYKPNTRSRVMDGQGRILSLENNFAHLNFNIGPTLFAWLEEHAPEVYRKILDADATSCKEQGHGNAIAQVYNHIMLPLANQRDATTQILWGIREFRHRFGRAPEAIWLPETGINDDTVDLLIEHGLKYVILSPTQAQRVCHLGEGDWLDVSDNSIDITQPYRLFQKERLAAAPRNAQPLNDPHAPELAENEPTATEPRYREDRFIDVFFYDGSLSSEISFSHLLQNTNLFAQKIQQIASRSSASRVLVHVATDGEIYGHHERFGDMSLAALLINKLPSMQVEVTNYSRFLALCPPTRQVELKPGSDDGEGTSWSCSHGVGRWYRDCGCAVDSPIGWNQAWRTPLRDAFDLLRDALADIFEERGRAVLRDPWAARNDYIEYVLNPTDETLAEFFERHAAYPLNEGEQSLALRLLEAQKYSMFTYTSCAWFFNDVSGLEPVQNMRYAVRAIQLVEDMLAPDFEANMLETLEKAASNMPQHGTGKSIYLNYAKPDKYTPERAANQLLLTTLIQQKPQAGKASAKHPLKKLAGRQEYPIHIYALRFQKMQPWQEAGGQAAAEDASGEERKNGAIFSGVIDVKDTTTKQVWTLLYATFYEASEQPVSYLKRLQSAEDAEPFFAAIAQGGNDAQQDAVRLLEQHGFTRYTLNDLYHDDREQVFGNVLQDYANSVEDHIETVYAKSVELLDSLTKASLHVPAALHASVEFALTYHAMIEMERLYSKEVGEYSPAVLRAALEKVLHLGSVHRLSLDMNLLRNRLTDALRQYIDRLSRRFLSLQQGGSSSDVKTWENFLVLLRDTLGLLEHAETIGVAVDKTEIQNMAHDILENAVPRYMGMFKTALQNAGQTESESAHQELHRFFQEYQFLRECLKLAQRLNFQTDRYRQLLISSELGVF